MRPNWAELFCKEMEDICKELVIRNYINTEMDLDLNTEMIVYAEEIGY